MALTDLIRNPQTEQEMHLWSWAHRVEHTNIRQRVQALTTINLREFVLEPINFADMRDWLEDHQQMHADMTSVTRVQSNDLERVDWNDPKQRAAWIELHYKEHFDVNTVLGL